MSPVIPLPGIVTAASYVPRLIGSMCQLAENNRFPTDHPLRIAADLFHAACIQRFTPYPTITPDRLVDAWRQAYITFREYGGHDPDAGPAKRRFTKP